MPNRIHAIATHSAPTELVFWVARRLQTANAFHGRRWWAKKREGDAWEGALAGAVGFDPAAFVAGERARLEISRLVPSTRHFIRDEENLWFATKPIPDALKRMGLIRDDSMARLLRQRPGQMVSPDGLDWTWIRLTAL